MIRSEYDQTKHNNAWINALTRNYAEKVSTKAYKKLGFTLKKKTVGRKTILEVIR